MKIKNKIMKRPYFQFIIITLQLLLMSGLSFSQNIAENPLDFTAMSINSGKKLYEKRCVSCHGWPSEGKNIMPSIPDLGTNITINKDDGTLYATLTNGVGAMPAYKDVYNDEERWEIINYIRSFDPTMKNKVIGTIVFPKLSFQFEIDEEFKTANLFVGEIKDDAIVPLSQLDINFFVQRMFGKLPLFEKPLKTNLLGKLSVTIPDDIYGDEEGKVKIIAQVADSDTYGNVERIVDGKYGKVSVYENMLDKRTLWGVNAKIPIWLLGSFFGILIIIWGGIFYVIFKLFRLKRL